MKSEINFLAFLKKYKWLFVVMLIVLILPIIIFCYIFRNNLFDVSSWANLVSCIVTYIGSAFLGITVFYHTWIQTQINNRLDETIINIEPIFNFNEKYITFLNESQCLLDDTKFITTKFNEKNNNCKTENYFGVKINNLNPFTPVFITVEDIYYVNPQIQIKKYSFITELTNLTDGSLIDNNKSAIFYFGISNEFFPKNYFDTVGIINLFVILKATTQKGYVKYYLEDYCLNGTLGENRKVMTEKEYKNIVDKFGNPIGTNWPNKQYFRLKRKNK